MKRELISPDSIKYLEQEVDAYIKTYGWGRGRVVCLLDLCDIGVENTDPYMEEFDRRRVLTTPARR